MGEILYIQLSVFSNKRIIPTSDNISLMMKDLKKITDVDYLPSIIDTQKVDIPTGKIETVSNLSFFTYDKKSQVVCTENRIDCNFNYEIKDQENINRDYHFAADILKSIMKKAMILGNRLALNVNFVSNVCNGSSDFENQVMHIVPFYQNKTIKEWSSRTNGKGEITINDCAEELNIITEYNHSIQQPIGEKRIVCHSDINTLHENKDYRFSDTSIDSFAEQTWGIFTEIQSDLEKMII